MPIKPATEQNPTIIGKTLSGAPTAFGPGAQISLNFERRAFLAVPGGLLFLNAASPTATIPYDADEAVLAALQVALKIGDIVLGSHPVPRAARQGLMEPLYQEVDAAETIDAIKPTIMQIIRGNKRMDGHPPAEIIRRLAIHETEGPCRGDFLNYFGDLLERIPGPGPIEDHPQDRVKILLDKDAAKNTPPPRSKEQVKAVLDLI